MVRRGSQTARLGQHGAPESLVDSTQAYTLFLNSIGKSFYAWFMLSMVLGSILVQRDWGPMYRAELRASLPVTDENQIIVVYTSSSAVLATAHDPLVPTWIFDKTYNVFITH